MSEEKKLSKLCLTGFLISILTPVLTGLLICCNSLLSEDHFELALIACAVLLPIAALIVSIVGVATAGKRGRKGKALGLIGIGLPVAYLVVIIALVVGYNAMSFSKNLATGQSDLYRMGHKGIGTVLNTEYDVSQYKIPQA